MTDLLVIGAGTAGLTAAIYGVRAGLTVKVIEQAIYGGQIISTTSIENYPGMPGISGADFATALYEQAKELGAQILYENIREASLAGHPKTVTTDRGVHEAGTVIIATGARPRKLGCPGEEELIGRGVSFCATCDGAFYRGKAVAVVGGGNVAVDDALVLSGLSERVTLIHRSRKFQSEAMQLEALRAKENVEILTDTAVKEIVGGRGVEKLVLEDTPTGGTRELAVGGVFIAIGAEPDNRLFAGELQLDEAGYVVAGEDCRTNLPGVFAAGDTRTKRVRRIVTATADGSVAAIAAADYLESIKQQEKEG